MLSLFRPRCPLNPGEKAWIEFRLSWLLEHFGAERLRKMETILPTDEFFPLPYRGEPEQAQAVFERVCRYMDVDPNRYRLHVFDSNTDARNMPPQNKELQWDNSIAFPFHDGVILQIHEEPETKDATLHLHSDMLADLEFLIGVCSRELSQSILLTLPNLNLEQSEYQSTVELMPIVYGLGIFGANAVFRERNENHLGWNYWSLVPWTNLPARLIGYALALTCWLRDEPLPRWTSYLRRDAEGTMRAALKYLQKTGDTILDRESPGKSYEKRPAGNWLVDLKTGTASRRVAALWAIQDNPGSVASGEAVSIISENLRHHDPVVRAAAARTLDSLGETAAEAVPDLLIALEDRHGSVRTMAALALGRMTNDADTILPDLLPMLKDRNVNVANAAAWAIGKFGEKAEEAGPALVHLLRRGILRCTKDSLSDILDALLQVTKHPEEVVTETLLERDAETCQRALDLLKEHRIDAVTQES